MKKIHFILFLLLSFAAGQTIVYGRTNPEKIKIRLDAKAEAAYESIDGTANENECGFKGRLLYLQITGNINSKLHYTVNQRLNKQIFDENFFDATDFANIEYNPTPKWGLLFGKESILTGGTEYDLHPLDLYFTSEYLGHLPNYGWGIHVRRDFNNFKDRIILQVCESPFRTTSAQTAPGYRHSNSVYAYNLIWYGRHGFLNTIWSVNAHEYAKGKFLAVAALGNEFRITGNLDLKFDCTFHTSKKKIDMKTYNLAGRLNYRPVKNLTLWIKDTYDHNTCDDAFDPCIPYGTLTNRMGGGFEFYPLHNDKLRIHGYYCYTSCNGTDAATIGANNMSVAPTLMNKQHNLGLGLTWRMDILK